MAAEGQGPGKGQGQQPPGEPATAEPVVQDPVLEDPPIVLPYAGAADEGVVESVPEHDPAAGDAVDFLRHEHGKLEAVVEEVLEQLDNHGLDAARMRWGGVVREALEHAVAEERVIWGALPPDALSGVREQQARLLADLRDQDALNPDVDAARIRGTVQLVREHARGVSDVVLPALAQLPAPRRMALADDLRQVMG